jgi:diadenosine tetraphosphatase ApaH/serine/threonine PP2A family protein phosphatase
MRLAILSDIHGNLEALETVLAECADLKVDRTVCLGDVVGYGADPDGCIDRVREVADTVLAGNHDWAAVGFEDTRFFNPIALAAIRWTASHLSDARIDYLRERPILSREEGVMYVHASPYHPESWHYLFTPEEGRLGLAYTEAKLCFVGHSHHSFVCTDGGYEEVVGKGTTSISPDERYLINVGSVGQPRDGDPRAAFAIWDREAGELELCRVPYDIPRAQAKIREAQLPGWLAERLAMGR